MVCAVDGYDKNIVRVLEVRIRVSGRHEAELTTSRYNRPYSRLQKEWLGTMSKIEYRLKLSVIVNALPIKR